MPILHPTGRFGREPLLFDTDELLRRDTPELHELASHVKCPATRSLELGLLRTPRFPGLRLPLAFDLGKKPSQLGIADAIAFYLCADFSNSPRAT
ncbi:hypothetical protein RBXJA2T_01960 [Rubrivivax benzoatilyticus JA2 = ATCC BAA-35]|nr:hypothetical protein RBXJA2T_01960 [Rubrivivax benzoatilyticus JA2 = ATCC BAA-35]